MGLQAADILDIMTHTHHDFDTGKFEDLVSDYRDTIVFKRLLNENTETATGDALDFYFMTDHNHNAGFYGLDEEDSVVHPNVLAQGSVPWRHGGFSWALEHHIVSMNRTPNKILDYAKTQYIAAMASWVIECEQMFWQLQTPTSKKPLGVPNWIVKNNTEGFNGGLPSGFTTVADVNIDNVRRYMNWTSQYADVSKTDLIRKLRTAATKTKFMRIVDDIPEHAVKKMGLYTSYDVTQQLEEILEDQNDNLGNDIASKDGKVMFRGMPFVDVVELENDTTDPIYMIPWGVFGAKKLRDWWGRRTQYEKIPGQRNKSAEFMDYTFNTCCYNRRKCAVLAKDTTLPA